MIVLKQFDHQTLVKSYVFLIYVIYFLHNISILSILIQFLIETKCKDDIFCLIETKCKDDIFCLIETKCKDDITDCLI
jgi:hypothetical protein